MQEKLINNLKATSKKLFNVDIEPELTRPEEKFGDFSTNLALQLGKRLGKNPREVAEQLVTDLRELPMLSKREVAGPGFINFTLKDKALFKVALDSVELPKPLAGQEIVLEHTDPNPFKEFHIGHAYSNTIGVAIGNLLQASGAKVHQVTYQGDVGLHIAMAVWAVGEEFGWQDSDITLQSVRQKLEEQLGFYYAQGAQAYRDNSEAKKRIDEINLSVYQRSDPVINIIYDAGRQASLEHFQLIYDKLDAVFEKNYFESDTAKEGVEIVERNTGKIFEKSDGAIIYDGEKVGLHKRVFITKQGLPTYEAKEIGLAFTKERDYPQAQSFVVITANEIDDYFKVLVQAIVAIDERLGKKIRHISHGVVKLPEGKMSSRTGKVKTFIDLEADIATRTKHLYGDGKNTQEIVLGAIKYEFLKHRVGSDFIFDMDESISLQGNSGPYLQYAHARAKSILAKAANSNLQSVPSNLEPGERSLARKISEHQEAVQKATEELMPHHICTYLYELAQTFNRFYEDSRIIGDKREGLRLELVKLYALTLKNGLSLLNISTPEHM